MVAMTFGRRPPNVRRLSLPSLPLPLLLLTLLLTILPLHAKPVVTIGGLFPLTRTVGIQRMKAAELAVDVVNASPDILPNVTLAIKSSDTYQNPDLASKNAHALIADHGVVALVGAASSSVSTAVAYTASISSIPQVSYSSTSTALSNSAVFPFFARTVPTDDTQSVAAIAVVQSFGWRHVVLLSAGSSYGQSLASAFTSGAGSAGIDVRLSLTHPLVSSIDATNPVEVAAFTAAVDDLLAQVKESGLRIVLLNSLAEDARIILYRAHALNMLPDPDTDADSPSDEPYVFVGSDGWAHAGLFESDAMCDDGCVSVLRRVLVGSLGLQPTQPPDTAVWISDVWNPATGETALTDCEKELSGLSDWTDAPNSFAPFAYDAVMAVARALDSLCTTHPAIAPATPTTGPTNCLEASLVVPTVNTTATTTTPPSSSSSSCADLAQNGSLLMSALLATQFRGVTGNVAFDGAGNRLGDFDVLNIQSGGLFRIRSTFVAARAEFLHTTNTTDVIVWPGGVASPPVDVATPGCVVGQTLFVTALGDSVCVRCQQGTVGRLDENGVAVCLSCPDGATCSGGATLTINKGNWFDPSSMQAGELTQMPGLEECRSVGPLACCPSGGCLVLDDAGTILFADPSMSDSLVTAGVVLNTTTSDAPDMCRSDHTGVLCADCAPEHSNVGGECIPCTHINWWLLVVTEAGSLLAVVLYVIQGAEDAAVTPLLIDFLQLFSVIVSVTEESVKSVVAIDFKLFRLSVDALRFAGCLFPMSALMATTSGYVLPLNLFVWTLILFAMVRCLRVQHRKRHTQRIAPTPVHNNHHNHPSYSNGPDQENPDPPHRPSTPDHVAGDSGGGDGDDTVGASGTQPTTPTPVSPVNPSPSPPGTHISVLSPSTVGVDSTTLTDPPARQVSAMSPREASLAIAHTRTRSRSASGQSFSTDSASSLVDVTNNPELLEDMVQLHRTLQMPTQAGTGSGSLDAAAAAAAAMDMGRRTSSFANVDPARLASFHAGRSRSGDQGSQLSPEAAVLEYATDNVLNRMTCAQRMKQWVKLGFGVAVSHFTVLVTESAVAFSDRFSVATWRVVSLSYLVVTETSLLYFQCRDVAGDLVMEVAPAVECYSGGWVAVVSALAIPALLFITIGIPMLLLLRMCLASTTWGTWGSTMAAVKFRRKIMARRQQRLLGADSGGGVSPGGFGSSSGEGGGSGSGGGGGGGGGGRKGLAPAGGGGGGGAAASALAGFMGGRLPGSGVERSPQSTPASLTIPVSLPPTRPPRHTPSPSAHSSLPACAPPPRDAPPPAAASTNPLSHHRGHHGHHGHHHEDAPHIHLGPNKGWILKQLTRLANAIMKDQIIFKKAVRLWYPAWFLARRGVLSAIHVGLAKELELRQGALFLACVLLLGIQFRVRPYSSIGENRFAFMLASFLVSLAGLEIYRVELVRSSHRTARSIDRFKLNAVLGVETACVAIPCIVWALWMLNLYVSDVREWRRHRVRKQLRRVLSQHANSQSPAVNPDTLANRRMQEVFGGEGVTTTTPLRTPSPLVPRRAIGNRSRADS